MHEAYLRLVDSEQAKHWNSRGHFFGAAAEAIRRILVEQARRKGSWKAGGRMNRIGLTGAEPQVLAPHLDMLALDEVLEQLEATDPRAAQVVKLRFFAGLTGKQAAGRTQKSEITKKRQISVGTPATDFALTYRHFGTTFGGGQYERKLM